MRLLNVHTEKLEDFTGRDVPPYSILSHRWGDDEVSFKEYRKGPKQSTAGYRKITDFCAFVEKRSFQDVDGRRSSNKTIPTVWHTDWVWIDTCCIDKRSSSELTEAINSMYTWYEESRVCYVYLTDVADKPDFTQRQPEQWLPNISKSQWFTRGWTLQELLAPSLIVFCNSKWQVIGHLCRYQYSETVQQSRLSEVGPNLLSKVSRITRIPQLYLNGIKQLDKASIAQRMSWASRRNTTRTEDEAYCLLGIFGINMPLLYGEGSRAFLRLQEEIIKRSTDQSILAWGDEDMHSTLDILARSPRSFRSVREEDERCHLFRRPYALTNNGLEMRTILLTPTVPESGSQRFLFLLVLNYSRSGGQPFRIPLFYHPGSGIHERSSLTAKDMQDIDWRKTTEQLIYVRTNSDVVNSQDVDLGFELIDISD